MTTLLLAEEGAPAGTERLLNFGALGVIVLLFITGWLVTGRQYKKLETRNEELQKYATDYVVPLLERTTRALENNTAVMQQLIGLLAGSMKPGALPLDPGDPPGHHPKEGT